MLSRRLTAPASQSPVSMGHQLCQSAQPRNCRTTPSRKAPARPARLRRGGESSARRCPRAAGGRQRAAGRRWRRQRRGDAAAASHSDVVDRHGRAAGRGKEGRRLDRLDCSQAPAHDGRLSLTCGMPRRDQYTSQARQQETRHWATLAAVRNPSAPHPCAIWQSHRIGQPATMLRLLRNPAVWGCGAAAAAAAAAWTLVRLPRCT